MTIPHQHPADLNTVAEQALYEAVATYRPDEIDLAVTAILGTLRPHVETAVRAFYGPMVPDGTTT